MSGAFWDLEGCTWREQKRQAAVAMNVESYMLSEVPIELPVKSSVRQLEISFQGSGDGPGVTLGESFLHWSDVQFLNFVLIKNIL